MNDVLQAAEVAGSRSVPDPKFKLIISSFLTLPNLLGCLICTRDDMFIVLLLQFFSWALVFCSHVLSHFIYVTRV